jgi:hypothetical protein
VESSSSVRVTRVNVGLGDGALDVTGDNLSWAFDGTLIVYDVADDDSEFNVAEFARWEYVAVADREVD